MFSIGFDPHRGSHAAVVLDHSETVLGCSRCPRIVDNDSDSWTGRRRSRRVCGRSKAQLAPERCWLNSWWPSASGSSM